MKSEAAAMSPVGFVATGPSAATGSTNVTLPAVTLPAVTLPAAVALTTATSTASGVASPSVVSAPVGTAALGAAALGTAGHDAFERSARVSRIWREWLLALATDSEAAMAAALAYRQLSDDVRDEWISTLDSDVDGQSISRVAVFAPLMAVETDPARRLRIEQLLQPELRDICPPGVEEYLQGYLDDDAVVSVIVSPLYLDFVQVLACAYVPGDRFLWVRHDPITCRERVAAACDALSGVELEPMPRGAVVDALARTVVAAHRRGDPLPEALSLFAHLFGAQL